MNSEESGGPRRDVCWYCGGRLILKNNYDYCDVFGEGKGIVTDLQCSECGAMVQYALCDETEQE